MPNKPVSQEMKPRRAETYFTDPSQTLGSMRIRFYIFSPSLGHMPVDN